jgi:molecular chaperone DnaK
MQGGVFQVLATHGDTRLGGDDLDAMILRRIMERSGIIRIDPAARVRLVAEAERVKLILSEENQAVFRVPFYDGVRSLEETITRAELEELAAPWIGKTLSLCRQALADAALKPEDLDAVVVVGGSTRMPAVRRAVEKLFGREPDVSQHPDEAVALGATLQGGMLSGALRQMILWDVTPLSLGIETFGGLMNVLIPRNTTIPCKAGEMFTNAADGQAAMRVRVLQGEREMAKDNWELGGFDVAFSPSAKGQARVGVQFKIDENGILEVLARDISTGIDAVIQIESAAVNVNDVAVEAMVSESVEHAFADMAERVFTEAKIKAEELLPAVEVVLRQELATADERGEIEAALAGVRVALADGAANRLKAAVQQLDSTTEALAARLVEQVMDAALDRQLADESHFGSS